MRIVYLALFVVVLFAVVALVLVSSTAIAAEGDACPSALSRGAQALQFQLGYDFRLNPFEGATLSYERFLRDRLALRLGVEATTNYNNGQQGFRLEGDTEGQMAIDLDTWSHQYSLVCQLVSYRKGKVALCYGAGPKVTYSNYQDQWGDIYGNNGTIQASYSTNWRRVWGVGTAGTAGVQWLLTERFRLHAEYGTAVMYVKVQQKRTYARVGQDNSMETQTVKSEGIQITPSATRLGLSVSF